MSKFRLEGSSALITGASAGIGREFARQLAGRASSLVLVARRQERLEELRDELTKRDPNLRVHIRAADLSDDRAVIELFDWLERERIPIDLLINNAGLGDVGPFATSELPRVKEMLAVNVTALTLLARLLLPGMIAQRRGAILNVSSTAGFLPIAGFAVYAATKAYVTSFSEAIRAELHGTGVTVTSLCPGPVPTEFTQVAARPGAKPDRSPEFVRVSVEEAARVGLAAIESGRPLVIPGFIMKLGMFLVRIMPLSILRLASRFSAKKL
jgi:short-subunit dehydrogenase